MDDTALPQLDRRAYYNVVEAAARVLDQLAVISPDASTMKKCEESLAQVERTLGSLPVLSEDVRAPAHAPGNPRFQPAQRGLVPAFVIDAEDTEQILGRVRFSPRFGGTAAVHGGALGLFFDDALGMIANRALSDGVARTAFLRIDYRSLAPLEVELSCRVWIDRIEGRKRFIRGELKEGERLVSEAEGLWVAPRPT